MRRHVLSLGAITALLATSVQVAPTAFAAADTCNGLPVTMTVTSLHGSVQATAGDDVIQVVPTNGDTGVPPPVPGTLAVFGAAGDDTLCNDLTAVGAALYGGPGNDTIIGGFRLDGGPGDDDLEGNDGSQTLVGDSGSDTLFGRGGNDNLVEGTGANGDDLVDGGPGHDTVDFAGLDQGVTVDLATSEFAGFGPDTISGIEGCRGTRFADTMVGTDAPDEFLGGGGGADHLVGGGGDDLLDAQQEEGIRVGELATIEGGDGNDRIAATEGTEAGGSGDDDMFLGGPGTVAGGSGDDSVFMVWSGTVRLGPGNDTLDVDLFFAGPDPGATLVTGGAGRDTFLVEFPSDPSRIVVGGGRGRDELQYRPFDARQAYRLVVPLGTVSSGSGTWIRFGGLESYLGERESDVMIGGPGADHFSGGTGMDILRGKGGTDVLRGEGLDRGQGHDDLLVGGAGPDRLFGDNGFDTADGGPGIDLCQAEVKRHCERRP